RRFPLHDDHRRAPGVLPQPGGVVGPPLHGEDPQSRRQPGALHGHRARSGADVPQDAGAGQGQLPEGHGPDLGLGDHPGPVGVAVVGPPAPAPARAAIGPPARAPAPAAIGPPATAASRATGASSTTTASGGKVPAASPARSVVVTTSPAWPSSAQTVTRRGPQPASRRARPRASGGWSGAVRTAAFGWGRTASTAAGRGRPWADTTTASSQCSPARAKATATDDGAG